jgi:hypothetical protein
MPSHTETLKSSSPRRTLLSRRKEGIRLPLWSAVFCALLALPLHTIMAQKNVYLAEIRKACEKSWREMPVTLERWKKDPRHSVLWGYNTPAPPLYLAGTYGYLYRLTGDRIYAERVVSLLKGYGDLRSTLAPDFASSRVEYSHGVPAVSNFFFLPPFARAVRDIRGSSAVSVADRKAIESVLGESIDFIFRFPEWGTHNRAMLRAEAFQTACEAIPTHPSVKRWRQMAAAIAGDNLRHWEIEDATVYHPVWLHAVLSYAESSEQPEVHRSAMMRYYMEYFTRLIAPTGMIPDFGDAYWESSLEALRMVAVFERGAAVFQDPAMKWAAQSIFTAGKKRSDTLSIGEAYYLCDAHRWADERVSARLPEGGSEEVLDDLIGKKVVFRNGWQPFSTYMLLNYRDEGDGGWLGRHYLRSTISVEEEKMHHGHADENSIALLMNNGSVLLHDAGYRSDLPSGPYGAWRQDYFHNRLVARLGKRDAHQSALSFVRNSGAYRAVRTQKIDFVRLRDVDMSRTRVLDEALGYSWDRVVTYVPAADMFLVIDGVRVLRPDYYTFTNFWHAGVVLDTSRHSYVIGVDSIGTIAVPHTRALRLLFLDHAGKTEGREPISRHFRTEQTIYQTISSQYKTGDVEIFVTALIPCDRGVRADAAPEITLVPTSRPAQAVAVSMQNGNARLTVGVKLDLDSEIARENIRPRSLYELGRTAYGASETDAHFFALREEGGKASVSAVNVLKFVQRGDTLMTALPNTHGLQLDGSPDRVGYSKWRVFESD